MIKTLFVVDAGGIFGFGHLARSRELALQLRETSGAWVDFLVDHSVALYPLRNAGFPVLWGSLGRSERLTGLGEFRDFGRYDLVVIDISNRRQLRDNWRRGFRRYTKIVAVDTLNEWSRDADRVVLPSLDRPILRREVRELRDTGIRKDLDAFVYLHRPWERTEARAWAARSGRKVEVSQEYSEDFPVLLARSKVFLSGYGISFTEALALGSFPVCLPHSAGHERDASEFYDYFNLPTGIIAGIGEMDALFPTDEFLAGLPFVQDGTPQIVQELLELQ